MLGMLQLLRHPPDVVFHAERELLQAQRLVDLVALLARNGTAIDTQCALYDGRERRRVEESLANDENCWRDGRDLYGWVVARPCRFGGSFVMPPPAHLCTSTSFAIEWAIYDTFAPCPCTFCARSLIPALRFSLGPGSSVADSDRA